MNYKLRYSRQFQIDHNETVKVEVEEEFDDSVAPHEALRILQARVDKMRPQLVEKGKVLGEELKIDGLVQTDKISLWQAWNQVG